MGQIQPFLDLPGPNIVYWLDNTRLLGPKRPIFHHENTVLAANRSKTTSICRTLSRFSPTMSIEKPKKRHILINTIGFDSICMISHLLFSTAHGKQPSSWWMMYGNWCFAMFCAPAGYIGKSRLWTVVMGQTHFFAPTPTISQQWLSQWHGGTINQKRNSTYNMDELKSVPISLGQSWISLLHCYAAVNTVLHSHAEIPPTDNNSLRLRQWCKKCQWSILSVHIRISAQKAYAD